MNELYEELETPEGERNISRIAKAKAFAKNDQIKDEQRVVLRDLDMIMGRWNGFSDKLLNGENRRFVFEDGVPNDGLTQGTGRNEIRVTLSRMKKGETTEMGGIPEGWWMCLGEEVINLMQNEYEQENISMEWTDREDLHHQA